jgi:hypothetical protein
MRQRHLIHEQFPLIECFRLTYSTKLRKKSWQSLDVLGAGFVS